MQIDFFGDEENKLYEQIDKDLFEARIINITQDVSSMTIPDVVSLIQHINLQDDKEGIPVDERTPIRIVLNSYGGSVYDGWACVSAIVNSKTPVHTEVSGYAMSMGLAIFLAGSKRYISKFATLMYHELSSRLEGSREEVRRASEEYDRLQAMYDGFLIERSSCTKEELEEHQKKVSDWYIGADVALEKGLATDLV